MTVTDCLLPASPPQAPPAPRFSPLVFTDRRLTSGWSNCLEEHSGPSRGDFLHLWRGVLKGLRGRLDRSCGSWEQSQCGGSPSFLLAPLCPLSGLVWVPVESLLPDSCIRGHSEAQLEESLRGP